MLEMFTDADPMRSDDFRLPADGWRGNKTAHRAQEGKVDIDNQIIEMFLARGMMIESGSQFSARGQIAQLLDVVKPIIAERDEALAKLAAMERQGNKLYRDGVWIGTRAEVSQLPEPVRAYIRKLEASIEKPVVAVPDERIIELAERLVAPGPKCCALSASECHEISDFIRDLDAPSHSQQSADLPSYHDLHITTAEMPRTSILNLPYNLMVNCTRAAGWELWRKGSDEQLLASEYGGAGLRLDVSGHVLVDSLPDSDSCTSHESEQGGGQ